MKLIWTSQAVEDRRAIYDYIDTENPRAAAELDEQFMLAADRLRAYPEMGRLGRVSGTRELVAHQRYFLLYEVVDDAVYVLAVVHTSRQWPPISIS